MMSISEHIKNLPEGIREEAVHNILEWNEDPLSVLAHQVATLQEALRKAFDWELSPQGFEYWEAIFEGERVTPRVTS